MLVEECLRDAYPRQEFIVQSTCVFVGPFQYSRKLSAKKKRLCEGCSGTKQRRPYSHFWVPTVLTILPIEKCFVTGRLSHGIVQQIVGYSLVSFRSPNVVSNKQMARRGTEQRVEPRERSNLRRMMLVLSAALDNSYNLKRCSMSEIIDFTLHNNVWQHPIGIRNLNKSGNFQTFSAKLICLNKSCGPKVTHIGSCSMR